MKDNKEIRGRIHSFESMGLVDGPGIRNVIFMQGCKLRCSYCHNPDTWAMEGGEEYTAQELLKKIIRFKPYFKKSGGGVTFTGGEPLLQDEFLLEMLKLCKENGIHTVIDTAGVGFGNYDEILKYVDLVLLDIKHVDKDKYKEITAFENNQFIEFLEAYKKSNADIWIRSVIIPGINDTEDYALKLKDFIADIPRVKKIELLPYHVLGVNKYKILNLKYRLEGVDPMDKERTKYLEKIVKGEA